MKGKGITDQQILDAYHDNGGNKAAAARQLNMDSRGYRRRIGVLAPKIPVAADGYAVSRTSTLTDAEGNVVLEWTRRDLERDKELASLQAMIDAFSESVKREKPVKTPKNTIQDLANEYIITDLHLGCLAWGEETGADWDLSIAEDTVVGWFRRAIDLAPKAATAYFVDIGDNEHYDSILAITPNSGNILDSDSRYQKVIRVMIRAARRIVRMLLEKHEIVNVIKVEGNHNQSTAIAAREWLYALYDEEPRVIVDRSARPYHCHQFGANMLCATHGHKKKAEQLPLLFASMFPEAWGATKYRYCETGHYHHHKEVEHSGMIVTQHQTLAAPDAHAARGGWISQRSASVKTYHKEHGLCGVIRITPDML